MTTLDSSATKILSFKHYRLPLMANRWPHWGSGGLPLCRGAIGIFCIPSWRRYVYNWRSYLLNRLWYKITQESTRRLRFVSNLQNFQIVLHKLLFISTSCFVHICNHEAVKIVAGFSNLLSKKWNIMSSLLFCRHKNLVTWNCSFLSCRKQMAMYPCTLMLA